MPRRVTPLTTLQVRRDITEPGVYCDGNCLYLQVSPSGTKSWLFRWRDRHSGKLRDMGLGPCPPIGLADAREAATVARKQVIAGLDPIAEKRKARAERRALSAVPTFDQCAEQYISAHSAAWSNPKHIAQWRSTLKEYASPVIGKLPVNEVTSAHILQILSPIWSTKTETASRVRGRIASVLDWAGSPSRGYRSGINPAQWRGHLDKELPRPTKVARREHHAALGYAELAAFMVELRKQEGIAARCLEFTILTACRTNESSKARWEEFDLKAKVWTVPVERMKAKREHRVPLSAAALAVLEQQRGLDTVYVFPGMREGSHLSNMAMLELLRGMGKAFTVHGFRSTFRDWAAEKTNAPREVCEMALAHTIGDKTEAAYRRGDLFEKRRKLMNDWARYASKPITA
jgi:integrase